jgi:YVTN family beta-propeller protein
MKCLSSGDSRRKRAGFAVAALIAFASVGCRQTNQSTPESAGLSHESAASTSSPADPETTPLITGRHIDPYVDVTQNVGSNPTNMLAVRGGRYAITTDVGYRQALWSLDTTTGKGVAHVSFPTRGSLDKTNGLYYGLAATPDGTLYASQGNHDSIAVVCIEENGSLTSLQTINTKKHDFPSGLALDAKGRLYVANNNPQVQGLPAPGSVAIYDPASERELGRFRFTESFGGTTNFPLSVAVLADGSKLYVASERDSAVYVLNTFDPAQIKLVATIPTGSHPDALLLDKGQRRLFVANADSDTVSIVDTSTDAIAATVLLRPSIARELAGASPTGLALSADEKWLYVTLGDMNAVAIVDVKDKEVESYVPAGWYPTGVVVSPDGKRLLVSNAKGTQLRNPNPVPGKKNHQSPLNIVEGNVTSVAIPAKAQFKASAEQVLANNRLTPRHLNGENPLKAISLRSGRIKHVIYIVKENRTYDQVLGDMPQGNGDKKYAIFGREVTPNEHALAERFVLLDNFYDCGEVSGDGWVWSTQAMANEYVIRNVPYGYSGRGHHFDYEGENNSYPAGGFPTTDPSGKPTSQVPMFKNGAKPIPDVAESPGGHLWDLAEKNGLTYRNFGFFENDGPRTPDKKRISPENWPSATGLLPAGHDLDGMTDIDFRRFDLDYPDSDAPRIYFDRTKNDNFLWGKTKYCKNYSPSRFSEWNRYFKMMLAKDPSGDSLPNLMTVRFCVDHTAGANPNKHTPRSMVADNDCAVGELVDAISHSPIWKSTAIIVIEDDAQAGPDHVDTHRSTCYVISPWIKRASVDHTFHNTASCLRTIENLLDLPPMCQYDGASQPIMDWDAEPTNAEPYEAMLPNEQIAMERNKKAGELNPVSPEAQAMRQSLAMDFTQEDAAPAELLDQIIWKSVRGWDSPMLPTPHGYIPASANQQRDDDD